ncbi:MAG: helix-turn-helix transcriptional regulator [Caldilineaceae bacterium]|nr:helix-turn-helix transcriptional regulator [Caldilineaceae bacterium]
MTSIDVAKCQVLFERSDQFHATGTGHLSIKTFLHGEARYAVGAARYRVNDDCYLVLNHGQEYTITIDAPQPVESFCIFFAPDLAAEVNRSLIATTAQLVDDPAPNHPPSLHFFERTYRHGDTVSPMLRQLRRTFPLHRHDPNWLAEQAHDLMAQLLAAHHQVYTETAALAAVRPATREELYRRLHVARDFIAASFAQPITLDEIAHVAALSPNHLLRTFKALFHATPHQYLTEARLLHASHLMRTTELSITTICLAVGFQSIGSFGTLFRRRFGASPAQFRQQKK